MAEPGDTLPLDAFLAALPEDVAGEARAAAAQIDRLEAEIGPPNWIERHFMPLAGAALVLFLLGGAALIGLFSGLQTAIGLGGVTLLVAAFPVLIFIYLLSVRGQTRLDDAKMRLNEAHFLPHGGVYFGALAGHGKVLIVPPPKTDEPDLRARVHAQYEAATKRKW